ncbi:hypothetical protein V8E54_000064 [Elaphomyces granulatus]
MGSVNNPAIMNLRDFIEEVGVDPSRPDMSSALQLKTSLNIPPLQAEEHCEDIDLSPIPTLIRLFLVELTYTDTERLYCIIDYPPLARLSACTIVPKIVATRGRIYFKKGRRWANFPSLAVNTPILVTARVSGFSTQGRCLALLVNDVYFLPGTPRLGLNSEHNSNSTGCSKRPRQDRWTRRAVQPTSQYLKPKSYSYNLTFHFSKSSVLSFKTMSQKLVGEKFHVVKKAWLQYVHEEKEKQGEVGPLPKARRCRCDKSLTSYPHWPPTTYEEAIAQLNCLIGESYPHRPYLADCWITSLYGKMAKGSEGIEDLISLIEENCQSFSVDSE